LSQSEIARKLGISQMHVSRLYRKAVSALQELVAEGEGKSG
jgi:DNA-directed RNA polymerase specialized sigma subunit